jgi:stress-induced-phosphoprotein 1
MLALGKYDEAIELYKTSLLENNDSNVKDQLRKAEKSKKEDEVKKLFDPAKAEEYREKGNEYFKEGNFPAAV